MYIAGGGKGVKDGKGQQKKKKSPDEEEEEGETYYDAMKKDMGDRAARTKVNTPMTNNTKTNKLHRHSSCYTW